MKKESLRKIIHTIAFSVLLSGISFGQNFEGFYYNIGEKIPNLNLTDHLGNSFKLHDLKGKPVIINLFATWCKPCMKEMKFLSDEIASKYDKSQIEIIAVGYDD